MKPKRTMLLIWYSVKEFFNLPILTFDLLKKAKTWSFILYILIIYLLYVKNITWPSFFLLFGLAFIIYLIRQNKEPEFNKMMKEKAFIEGDDEVMKKHYQRYEQECFYRKTVPLEYAEWKEKEKTKITERKRTESETDYTEY